MPKASAWKKLKERWDDMINSCEKFTELDGYPQENIKMKEKLVIVFFKSQSPAEFYKSFQPFDEFYKTFIINLTQKQINLAKFVIQKIEKAEIEIDPDTCAQLKLMSEKPFYNKIEIESIILTISKNNPNFVVNDKVKRKAHKYMKLFPYVHTFVVNLGRFRNCIEALSQENDDDSIVKFQLAKIGRFDIYESILAKSETLKAIDDKFDQMLAETKFDEE